MFLLNFDALEFALNYLVTGEYVKQSQPLFQNTFLTTGPDVRHWESQAHKDTSQPIIGRTHNPQGKIIVNSNFLHLAAQNPSRKAARKGSFLNFSLPLYLIRASQEGCHVHIFLTSHMVTPV